MRTNTYKEKIVAVLDRAHLLSIAAIQEKITKADFSTIFRNLEQLCAEGIVRKVSIAKDNVLYELVEKNHHHDHFVCDACGAIESVCLSKTITSNIKGSVRDVLIRGTCLNCIK